MQRHVLGMISIVMLSLGASLYVWQPFESLQGIHGMCVKVGVVLLALWLAFPQINRLPAWLFQAILVSVVVVARWPRMIFLVVPIAIAYWMLQPRRKTKAPSHVSKSSADTRRRS